MNIFFLTSSHLMWKYLFFHKPSKNDEIRLVLPKYITHTNNRKIARADSIKCLHGRKPKFDI